MLCALCIISKAQHLITEGTITYKITISGKLPSADNQPAITESKTGTMTLQIKGDNTRQDITLEDGYSHAQISNFATGKEIILQSVDELKYAIEIDMNDKKNKSDIYKNTTMTLGVDAKTIAGREAQSVLVTYKDKSTFPMFILLGYELDHPEIFDHFPDIKGIPASYDLTMKNGFTTHFELTSLVENLVDNATFRIPEGYRIIKQKEYEKLMK